MLHLTRRMSIEKERGGLVRARQEVQVVKVIGKLLH